MKELKLDNVGYPFATYSGDGKKYYILEPGHDYTIKEDGDNIGYEFDFDSPVYHPMLVDGVMKNVNITKNDDNYIINNIAPTPLESLGLKIENNLRAYIHLNKVVLDKDSNPWHADKTRFEYTIDLRSPIKLEGKHIPWYAVNKLFYHDSDFNYYQADPLFEGENQLEGVLTLKTESGHECQAGCEGFFDPDIYGPTEITYIDENNKEKTIQLYGNMMEADANQQDIHGKLKINQDERLTIANIPAESTYNITESPVDEYVLVDIAPDNSKISQRKISGDIVANADNNVTFTNKVIAGSLDITKSVLVDGQSTDTIYGYADGTYSFTITDAEGNPAMGKVGEEWIEDGRVSIEIKNGEAKTIRVTDLRIGEYSITEDEPKNGTTLIGFAINGQSKTVENGVVAGENDKKIMVMENTVAAASFTNNINTTAVEVHKVWTDDGQPGVDHTVPEHNIQYEIYRTPYVMVEVEDPENPDQTIEQEQAYSTQVLVDQNLVPTMNGYSGLLNDSNSWREVVTKLPKTGAVWDESNKKFTYLTYKYTVKEITVIEGYKTMLSGGEVIDAEHPGEYSYDYTITNEPLGPIDQETKIDVKKQWNNADGTPDTDPHENDTVVFTATQKKYEALVTYEYEGHTYQNMLYPITVELKDERGNPGSGHVTNEALSTVVYVPAGAEFNITPTEGPGQPTVVRDHYVRGYGFSEGNEVVNHTSGQTYTIDHVNSAMEITLDLNAGNDTWVASLGDGDNYRKWMITMYSPQGIIWHLEELQERVLANISDTTHSDPVPCVDPIEYSYTIELREDENGLYTFIDTVGNAPGHGAGSATALWEGSITHLPLYEYRESSQGVGGTSYIYTYEVAETAIGTDTVNTTINKPENWNGQTSSYLVKWGQNTDKTSEEYGLWTLTNQKKPPIEVSIHKVDKNNLEEGAPLLQGAKFKLIKYSKLVPTKVKDLDWGTRGESVVVSEDPQNPGIFSFENLNAGYYEIVETQYPDGYITVNENPIIQVRYNKEAVAAEVVLVHASGEQAGQSVTGNTTEIVRISNEVIVVGNEPGAALPNSGGSGTKLFTILGSILIAGAGWLLWRRRRLT